MFSRRQSRQSNQSRPSNARRGEARRSARLHSVGGTLETLENRVVLSTVEWSGLGGNNLWSNPDNWSGGEVPDGTSDVVIDDPSAARSVVLDAGPVTVRSLTLNERLVINRGVVLNSGGEINLGEDAELRINGLMNWVAGTWDEGADATVNPGGRLNIGRTSDPTIGVVTLENDLLNRGMLAWRGGDIVLTASGSIKNDASKAFDIASPKAISGEGLLENFGILRRGGTAVSTTTIDVDFNNDDRVRVLRGTLALGGTDPNMPTVINYGEFAGVAKGSGYILRASAFHRDATYRANATYQFAGGTHLFRGDIFLGGAVFGTNAEASISPGGATIRGDATFNNSSLFVEGPLAVGGTLTLNSTDVAGGQISVPGVLNVNASSLSNHVSVLGSGSLSTTGAVVAGRVTNAGTIDVLSGVLTLDVQGNGAFLNSGTLRLGSTSRLDVQGSMTNTGLIQTSVTSSSFGRVTVTGTLTLGGTLRSVFTGNGFSAGQNRTVLTGGTRVGTFANVNASGLPGGMSTTVLYNGTSATVRLVG